jgi:ferredoxin
LSEKVTQKGGNIVKAKVDKDLCIGCGLCVQLAPEVFRMEGDIAVAITGAVPLLSESRVNDSADQCPVAAISAG